MNEYANKTLSKAKQLKQKANRKALSKFNMSDVSVLKRKAQTEFNKYIRLRDAHLPCISCGYNGTGRQWHASHFRPATNSRFRFDERNVWKSCQICNTHLSGNLAEYRKSLLIKVGEEVVEELETTSPIKRWSVEELIEIITISKEKTKKLNRVAI